MNDDGLGGSTGSGVVRFASLLVAGAILALGLLQRRPNADAVWLLALAASAPFFALLLWPRLPRDLPTFNRTVVRLGTLLVVAFLLLSIHLVRLQVVHAADLANATGVTDDGEIVANQRVLLDQLRQQRGRIVDRNGQLLADTAITPEGFAYRQYPSAIGSYVVGYDNPQLYGKTGLEAQYDAYLRGSAGPNPFDTIQRELLHRPIVGNDLVLTLDLRLQQAADEALAGRAGAVVALDPRTGAILADVSAPHFDPQQLVVDPRADEAQELARVRAYWAAINEPKAGDPLLMRGTQGLYVPGSIFKTVTAATALDAGIVATDKVYPDPGDLVIEGHRIVELNRPAPVKDRYTVAEGYLYSLNIVFAQVALDVGTVRMNEYARHFGFGQEIPFAAAPDATDASAVASRVSADPNYLSGKPALADTGFGQGELQVSPLHMALIAAAMANGGKMPEPYLVGAIRAPGGNVVAETRPKTWLTPINGNTADQVKKLMIASVESGGSTRAKVDGLVIGGKTGTAEIGDGDSHAWFICFAGRPNRPPEIAIAVIVERGGPGSTVALPIAKHVIETYFATAP